jgi:cytochrome P450
LVFLVLPVLQACANGGGPGAACPAEALLGEHSISIMQDAQLHSRLRQVMGPTFSPEAVAGLMPGVQQTVAKHVARWAQQGSFTAYPAVRLLTFDVLVNQALGLGMDDDEILHFSKVPSVMVQWPATPAARLVRKGGP